MVGDTIGQRFFTTKKVTTAHIPTNADETADRITPTAKGTLLDFFPFHKITTNRIVSNTMEKVEKKYPEIIPRINGKTISKLKNIKFLLSKRRLRIK